MHKGLGLITSTEKKSKKEKTRKEGRKEGWVFVTNWCQTVKNTLG
jgi:hypothetical protein